MRNLLNFLARYNNLILFLLLEGIAIYLVVTRNNYHNSRIINGIKGVTRVAEEKITNTKNYLRLRNINAILARENALLRNELEKLQRKEDTSFVQVSDTLNNIQYRYTAAVISNNSVNRQKNFFTINKGRKQGIGTDMAVTGPDGVAGIIVGCSDNYSVAMSLLSLDFRLSARLRSTGYFGSLAWDGRDYRFAVLNEIPQHVSVTVGDTVETTGYSAIFPEGIMIGTVIDYQRSGSDFYNIKVALSTDFRLLSHVSVIRNLRKEEQQNAEKQYQ